METETYIWIAAGLFVYFFPTYLGFVMGHADRKAIFFLNLLLGWTIGMWLILAFWSLSPEANN